MYYNTCSTWPWSKAPTGGPWKLSVINYTNKLIWELTFRNTKTGFALKFPQVMLSVNQKESFLIPHGQTIDLIEWETGLDEYRTEVNASSKNSVITLR